MLSQIFFDFLIDALRLILRHSGGTSSSKREVYNSQTSFIWVVKERREGQVRNFLLLYVHYIPLLMLFI